MRYIVFVFLAVLQLNAQEILFEGHVHNKNTKEPIPYVNISFLNTLVSDKRRKTAELKDKIQKREKRKEREDKKTASLKDVRPLR